MNVFLKLFLVFLCASPAFADATRNKLNDLSERLITSFTAKTPGKTAIAIFPLNADEKLTKRKAGFAVSEIISRKFLASEKFTVVERGDIDKMLAEQKLQASGAVGADSAVSIGRIIGAKTILTGNILKIGGQYQVNIRLVDTESSEVIGSGYAELDWAAFEEEARPYLNLVPDEQVLSVYFLYNFRNNANVGATMRDDGALALYSDPSSFNLGMLGGGVRYFPSQKIFVDVSFAGNGKQKAGNITITYLGRTYPAYSYYIDVLFFRGLLGYKAKIGDRFNLYTGLGAASYEITGKDPWGGSGEANVNYYTPTIQARVEYRPQSRVGVSIAAGYDFISKAGTKGGSKRVILGKLSFEPSVSVYF